METDHGRPIISKDVVSNGNVAEFMGTHIFLECLKTAPVSIQLPISPQYHPLLSPVAECGGNELSGH